MKTIIIALISTLVMFNGAKAQDGRGGDRDKPVFYFQLGDLKPGLVTLEAVKAVKGLRVFVKCPKHSDKKCCEVLAFKLILINLDGKKKEVINQGPYLNERTLELLKEAKGGDYLVVAGVAIKCHDKTITLPLDLKFKIIKRN